MKGVLLTKKNQFINLINAYRSKSKKPTKVGFKQNKKGITVRFAKKSGDFIND